MRVTLRENLLRDIFWENQAIVDKARKWPTQIFLIFICIIHIIVKSKTLKFFSLKLYGLGVWAQQNSLLKEKNTAFSQRWVFKDKFGLRATHEHKVFLRNRKYGWRGPTDWEKVRAVIAQNSYQVTKTQFFQFSESFGAKYFLRR